MSELIVRCDDFGLTQGCSLGILRALEAGCVSSVGVIVNTGVREDDVKALGSYEGLCIGLHFNIVAGRPLADLESVSGLVDETGTFFPSRRYRTTTSDLIDGDEVEAEASAQVECFRKLLGRDPAYIDCHSVATPHLDRALTCVADRIGVPYVDMRFASIGGGRGLNCPTMPDSMAYDSYDPLSFLIDDEAGVLSHERTVMVFHPAFLDEALVKISTLREGRMKDFAALVSPRFASWIGENGVELAPIV